MYSGKRLQDDISVSNNVFSDKPIPWFAKWWLGPIAWPTFGLVGIASLHLLFLGIHPSLYYMADIFHLFLLWGCVGLICSFRYGIREIGARAYRQPQSKHHWHREALLAAILVSTTILIGFKIPLRLGFLTALSGLTQLQEKIERGEEIFTDQRCGYYLISATESASANRRNMISGGTVFILADDHESGFIYSQKGIEHLGYNAGCAGHLMGNWYWMKED